MRNVRQFKSDRNLTRKFGGRQEAESIYTDEQRQRAIEIYLQVREEEKVEQEPKESTQWQIEITPKHKELVNQILAERDADFNNHVADTNYETFCAFCTAQDIYPTKEIAINCGWEIFNSSQLCPAHCD